MEFEKASELFLEAVEFADGDPLGRANVVLAHILRTDLDAARVAATEALTLHPDDTNLAVLRIMAALGEANVTDPRSSRRKTW